jgi:hypothetical protein
MIPQNDFAWVRMKSSIHRKFFPQNFAIFNCPYQFCGGIISAILGEIVLGVNNFGGQFPFFWEYKKRAKNSLLLYRYVND